MPPPQQPDVFTHAFHRLAISRLAQEPAQVGRALQNLQRWRDQRDPLASDPYLHKWADLQGQAASKCAAGRPEHPQYVSVLLKRRLDQLDALLERISWPDAAKHDLAYVTQWTQRSPQEASA